MSDSPDDESVAGVAIDSSNPPQPTPEQPSIQALLESLNPTAQEDVHQLATAIQGAHRGIGQTIRDEEEEALADIAMLWEAAVSRSGTIRFAIEKLSRKDATGEPVEATGFTKRMVNSIIRLGGVAGSMWTGTPAGVLGGSAIQQAINGDPTHSALNRVTDADMLILAKEVEALQSDMINRYYEYTHAADQWQLAQQAKRDMALLFWKPGGGQ
jgi:hypothetical protein